MIMIISVKSLAFILKGFESVYGSGNAGWSCSQTLLGQLSSRLLWTQ